jgi:ataxin-3
MRPFQSHPEWVDAILNSSDARSQAAFILHLDNHWLPLRKFGSTKRWYNLNSFLPQPEWISNTYLALVLQQAEKEGYSVFVVRSNSKAWEVAESAGYMGDTPQDEGVGALPDCEADRVALGLNDPTGRGASFAAGQATSCELLML